MWDFSFELPALLLIGIILAAYNSTKHLPTRQNRLYLKLTFVFIAAGLMNVLSGWMDQRFSSVWTGRGRIALDLINLIFYILLFARTMCLLYYYVTALVPGNGKLFRYLYGAGAVLGGILVAPGTYLGCFHTYSEAGFQIASGYRVFAFIQLGAVCVMVLLLCLLHSSVSGALRRCLILVQGISLISALFDLLLPYILISDMLMALILLALYLFYMNPGYYISGRTGTFNMEGLRVMLQSYDPAEYRILGITLKNYLTLREIFYPAAVSGSLMQIGACLDTIPGAAIFYVRDNTIQVYLQPLINARDGSLAGAEALARLIDPEMGFISPGEFIPIAEDTGIITELGRQVFEKTCLFLKGHEIPGLQWINVNVSPAQFVNIQLSDQYSAIVRRIGIEPERLHLEITEAAYVSENSLHQRMNAFLSQNFRMVLDDFGSGYSNLNRVMDYPFSNIKLDMDFVRMGLAKHKSMLGDLIHAFHDMGFSVTAEGIETEEMAASMRQYGCDFFQGFLYSKPLPMDEFAEKYGHVQSSRIGPAK